MRKPLFNLYAFDGGAGAGAGAGAAAGASGAGAATGTSQAAAGEQAQGLTVSDSENATHTEQSISFDDFVKEHKDEASKWFQKQFNRRHADYNDLKNHVNASNEVFGLLGAKYGLDPSDIEGITKAVKGDDALLEEQAYEAGMTVDQYRTFTEAQAENKRLRAEQKAFEQQQQIQLQMQEWDKQANNLKQIFPDFDLDVELENPEFERALRGGLSIDRAYYAVHGAEIASGAMQYTAQAVRQATAQDLAARKNRPVENGLSPMASVKVTKDVHNLSKKDRAELIRRSMNGEQIRF